MLVRVRALLAAVLFLATGCTTDSAGAPPPVARAPDAAVVSVAGPVPADRWRAVLIAGDNSSPAFDNGVEAMREAIQSVLRGGVWTPPDVDLNAGSDAETAALLARLATLTPQQVRVLMMLSEGLLNKQIAYELGVSEATIKAHVSAILQKLGVESRTQAVIAAAKISGGQWRQGTPSPQ